jgi:uncharacterized membrane protein
MTMDSGGAPVRRSRWVKIGIVASLALNLLFAGGLAAAAWHHRHGGRGDDSGLMGFARGLPAERQKMVRDDVAAARLTIRPLRKAVREAWNESNALLTAEPFDKDKYRAGVDKLTDAESRFKTAIAAALADTAAKLTPEERRNLQGWREKRRPHMFGGHGRRDGPGGEGKGPDAGGPDDKGRGGQEDRE